MSPDRAMLRVGLPKPGGALVAHARSRAYPLLISANALVRDTPPTALARAWRATPPPARLSPAAATRWRREPPPREFLGWRRDLSALDGLDVALDSAGFVAWARYGDFRWSVEAYVDLALRRPWAWWAQMDACVEKAVAANPDVVRLRQAETLRLQGECEARAARVGATPPLVVLQGRNAEDYVWHARRALTGREELVGVGSMCTRPLHRTDEDGLLDVVTALDVELAAGTRLHLFGVKAAGLKVLGQHPRIASTDSMAWDSGARWSSPTGTSNDMSHRCAHMDAWVAEVRGAIESADSEGPAPRVIAPRETPSHIEPVVDLILDGELELQGALAHLARPEMA